MSGKKETRITQPQYSPVRARAGFDGADVLSPGIRPEFPVEALIFTDNRAGIGPVKPAGTFEIRIASDCAG
jgi:hypothetical protein